jgi:hypothetical protein
MVKNALENDDGMIERVAALVRLADVGIECLELREQDPPESVKRLAQLILTFENGEASTPEGEQDKRVTDLMADFRRQFSFHHVGHPEHEATR